MERLNSMDRILFLSEWFRPDMGGSITIYDNIYNRYDPSEIIVLTKTTKGWREYDKTSKIPIYRIPHKTFIFLTPESLMIYILTLIFALYFVLTKNIKVIHCEKVLRVGLVAYLIKKILKTPYILYAHGEEITLRISVNKDTMQKIYDSATYIIANSNNTKNLLMGLGVNEGKIQIIYPGVDAKTFNPCTKFLPILKRHNLEKKRILLTVSRIEKKKGHDNVIKSLPMVIKKIPNLVYLVVGKGSEENQLKHLVQELNLEKNVIFVGEAKSEELPAYFCCCDIFIMMNRDIENKDIEGFGIVFIEASACGKPVIGGNSGGAKEAIVDGVTGFLVEPTNLDKISEKIILLLSNSALAQKLGSNGRKRAKTRFGWANYYKRIRSIENNIINKT